jgi:hypothetical protein
MRDSKEWIIGLKTPDAGEKITSGAVVQVPTPP